MTCPLPGLRSTILSLVCVFAASAAAAQTAPATGTTTRGQAIVVPAADIRAVVATLAPNQKNIDKVVRTVETNGPAGHVSIAAVAYHAGPQNWDGRANEHRLITEVFYVTKGSATFVIGGDLENPTPFDPNSDGVKKVGGPGQGGTVKNYKTVKTMVGDSVVLPPNTPHQIVDVSQDFEMVVIRIDPNRVLQLQN